MQERVRIEGEGVTLRPLLVEDLEPLITAYSASDRTIVPVTPDPGRLKARVERSGMMIDGALDLGIEVDGRLIGAIQTYVPTTRSLPLGSFEVGIAVHDLADRGRGYGTEAFAMFVDWLFDTAGADRVQALTAPDNVAMRRVLERLGFTEEESIRELDLDFVPYAMTSERWHHTNRDR